jgi:DNA polymerase/3'-5' exonuclease PolX
MNKKLNKVPSAGTKDDSEQKDEDMQVSPAIAKPNVGSIPLSVAQKIAVNICYKLQPYCEKINIAGSVRRQKLQVKDIEIVCIPKVEVLKDMFGWDEGIIRSVEFSKIVNELGKIIKGNSDGKYIQIELPEGVNLDLFIPDDFDYYRQYAIRTGSADYSAKVIAGGWRKIGWCGSDKGLRKMSDCVESKTPDGKSKWKCINADAGLPPVWKSEEHFFEWLNVKWLHPSQRVV